MVSTLRKSYSLSDLSEPDVHRSQDEIDEVMYRHRSQHGQQQRYPKQRVNGNHQMNGRSASGGRNGDMYFGEVDVTSRHSGNYE